MYYNYNDISVYYEKIGDHDKSIIILPGWGDTRNTFNYMINFLKEYYTVYIFDYPGFGNSKFPKKDLNIYDYATIVLNFINHNNIINPIIIAHSFGGRIATLLSGYYNLKIDKLLMIDVSPIKPKKTLYKILKQKAYKLLKKISSILPNKYKNKYFKKLIQIFGSNDYKSIPKNMQKTFINIVNEDLKKYLDYISCETLICWGKSDKSTPLKYGKAIRKRIKNSALIVFPKSAHFPYLDYPILFNNIIKEFLK